MDPLIRFPVSRLLHLPALIVAPIIVAVVTCSIPAAYGNASNTAGFSPGSNGYHLTFWDGSEKATLAGQTVRTVVTRTAPDPGGPPAVYEAGV